MILQSSDTYLDPISLAISLPSLETNSVGLFEFISRFLVWLFSYCIQIHPFQVNILFPRFGKLTRSPAAFPQRDI